MARTQKEIVEPLTTELLFSKKDIGLGLMRRRQEQLFRIPSLRELSGKKIKKIRIKLNCSRQVFGKLLGVEASTIQNWEERGFKPSGTALKLLNLLELKGINSLF